jgi:hypothetical protein
VHVAGCSAGFPIRDDIIEHAAARNTVIESRDRKPTRIPARYGIKKGIRVAEIEKHIMGALLRSIGALNSGL